VTLLLVLGLRPVQVPPLGPLPRVVPLLLVLVLVQLQPLGHLCFQAWQRGLRREKQQQQERLVWGLL
jgi:hypothetical protein